MNCIKKRFAYFKIEENFEIIEKVMTVCIHIEKVLMIQDTHGFPTIELKTNNTILKQIQRAMYEKYGVLIKESKPLGSLSLYGKPLPVFVCNIAGIEKSTPFGMIECFKMIDFDKISEKLKSEFWKNTKNHFLYHTYHKAREMMKEEREDMVRKEFYFGY